MQAITLATAAHPLLAQGVGPSGEHFKVEGNQSEFPHEDEENVCWQPVGYEPEDDGTDKWVDYEDSTSELMRAQCDTQDWLEVCSVPLDWEEVDCKGKIDTKQGPENGVQDSEEDRFLPGWVIFLFQFLSWLWEMHVVMIVTLPWWFFIFSIAMFDYALDFTFWLLFGWYCKFCAGLFVWAVNLVHLPFTLWGWFQRIFLEIFGAPVDAWMILFGWSGCFIFIGKDCYLQSWDMYWVLDIPYFTKRDETQSLAAKINEKLTIPKIESAADFWTIREKHRREFMAVIPGFG